MASASQIKSLLQSHGSGDNEHFYSVALQVAAAEARRGHQRFADEIRDLVKSAKKQASETSSSNSILSLAQPRGEVSDLLDTVQTDIRIADLILPNALRQRIERVLSEQRNLQKLKENDLRPRQRLLFTGPPGCGKTMTAAALAAELKLPLFVVRLDSLLSRFLGESLSKLRLVFEAAEQTRAVYLFDEFDSIGYTRDATGDVGEMRRVLNAFLVFIEQLQSNSLIIAATNHGNRLDRALFRRFDDLIEFGLPEQEQSREIIKRLLSTISTGRFNWSKIDQAASDLSYAEITRACEEAIKEMLISDLPEVTQTAIVTALTERRLHLNH